eukprot:TRINITY_DN7142_c0_g1_i1.p1 TRINITY_DN7142_c0_g1~~TRINITY_DN7142_c0_g1_i1.p1  ORF type:complete len:133 (+),score=7.20 TRINITY_DN7142_c0_g1_i1:143-541(+)
MPSEVIWPFVGGLFGQTICASSFGVIPWLFLEHGDYAGCPVCMGSVSMVFGPWISLFLAGGLSKFVRVFSDNVPTSFIHSVGLLLITSFCWFTIASEMPTGIRIRHQLSKADILVLLYMAATLGFQIYLLVF